MANSENLKRALTLAQEIADVGHVREDSAKRYQEKVLIPLAGAAKLKGDHAKGLTDAGLVLMDLRSTGELREEANDRYQEILHLIDADGAGVDVGPELETKAAPATKAATRKPARKSSAARAKSKG